MKLGLIVRSESRGLGNLSYEVTQHLHPERVLLVVPNHQVKQRYERFPDATVVQWDHRKDGTLDESVVRAWLDGLDIVWSAETFYDWRVCDWAREVGVKTVCHVMPEYFRHWSRIPPSSPDAWWTPTHYRLNHLPPSTRVVPVPVALERFGPPDFTIRETPPRWLHVAGVSATGDRNGTTTILAALPLLKREHLVRIRTTGGHYRHRVVNRLVKVEQVARPTPEYWQLYSDADALLSPRKYAGLSLPALEAMAAGLALVMSDTEPQASEWPIIGLPTEPGGTIRVAGGEIPMVEVTPAVLAARMDWLADHPEEILAARKRAYAFAQANSWGRLEPMIRSELEKICS